MFFVFLITRVKRLKPGAAAPFELTGLKRVQLALTPRRVAPHPEAGPERRREEVVSYAAPDIRDVYSHNTFSLNLRLNTREIRAVYWLITVKQTS